VGAVPRQERTSSLVAIPQRSARQEYNKSRAPGPADQWDGRSLAHRPRPTRRGRGARTGPLATVQP